MKKKFKNIIFYVFIFIFIGMSLSSCLNLGKEDDLDYNRIYINSFDYKMNRNKATSANELSYSLSFEIEFSLKKEFSVNDLVVRISSVEEAIDNNKSFHFVVDYCNTEGVTISPSTEKYPYILLNYSTDDLTFSVNVDLKITTMDLIDDINHFLKIDCSCNSKRIIDDNHLLEDDYFKMSFTDDSYIYYEFDEFSESYKVVSFVDRFDHFEIPATYQGYPVKSIDKGAFYGCSKLKSITIPDSVTSITEDAFSGCVNIEKATIPTIAISCIPKNKLKEIVLTSGTSIEDLAFSECSVLTSVTLPDSITSIGDSAFGSCSSLTNVYYEGTIENWCKITFTDCDSNPMYYASHFHLKNSNNEWEEVTSIEIPNTITEIKDYQFYGFVNVTFITIPNSVTSIGHKAYSSCNNLESITFGNSVTSIGEDAFYGCSSLASVEIPNSVTIIGYRAFSKCSSLTNITIPFVGSNSNGKEYTHFGYIFGADSYTGNSDYVPSSLREVIITGGTSIGDDAFRGCSSLTSITIPNSVTSIGGYAFKYCSSLTSITIPNSVTSIGSSAFSGCSSFTSITIPNSVTIISDGAFDGCYRLVEIYNLSSLDITIGSESNGHIGYYAKVIHISLEEESNIITKDDYVFIKDKENNYYLVGYNGIATDLVLPNDIEGNNYEIYNYAFYNRKDLTSVSIPDSVTNIGVSAFMGCSNLTSVELPNNITSIEDMVFSGCSSLASITMPDKVASIGMSAFSRCSSLTSIVIPNSVTSIGQSAFSGCSSLTSIMLPFVGARIKGTENPHFGYIFGANSYSDNSIYVPSRLKAVIITGRDNIGDRAFSGCSSLTSVTIGNGVKIIGRYAFSNCSSLASVVIPRSVTSIEASAFANCDNLKIYYEGSATEWDNIEIGYYNTYLKSVTIYYYSATPTSGNYWHYVDGTITKW